VALRSGSLTLDRGSIHALIGENGAGKSTLVKIIAGLYHRDAGELLLDGESVDFSSTAQSKAAGIAVIYQEPTLFPDLSVTENIFMGRQPTRSLGRIDRKLMREEAIGLFARLGVRIDPDRPTLGLSIADHLLSCHIAQGVTALLVRRFRTGEGGLVESSLLESVLDLQFELLSTHLNDTTVTVQRKGRNSAHAFLPAPYGVFPTSDGYLSLAMNPIPKIGSLLGIHELVDIEDPQEWWTRQAEIEALISAHLALQSTEHWLALLDAGDVWCAPVLTLEQLVEHDGFDAIDMTQRVVRDASATDAGEELTLSTTRSPIRIDGHRLTSTKPAPKLGQHNDGIRSEFASTEARR
jgi:ABC-type sugar transport system ATPase subunit